MREVSNLQYVTKNVRCFSCKQHLDVHRKSNCEDLVFYNKRYYHRTCFVESQNVKQICFQCKKDITTSKDELSDIAYYNSHFYHKPCFEKWCDKPTKAGNISKKKMLAKSHIEQYVVEAAERITQIEEEKNIDPISLNKLSREAKNQIKEWFAKSDVNALIREYYGTTFVPYHKLLSIYEGTHEKLLTPIPAVHLYDMWLRKLDYLDKIHARMITQGKKIEIPGIISYDLEVLVSKYDSYLKWLETQKILQASVKTLPNGVTVSQSTVDTAIIQDVSNAVKITNEEQEAHDKNISQLADDIFD